MLPHKKTSEVIDLTNEPEPEPKADLKSEILSMSAHKPRPPPLAYKHSSQSQSHSQPQNQTRAQQEHFSAILGQPDFVPVTSSFDGQLLRTSASISYPAASKSPRAPIGLEMFCSRRYSVSGIPANLTGSGSSKPAATGTTSKPAGSNTQLEPDDQTTRPLRDSTELASPLCQPSGQSAPSWSFERLESAAEKRAAAAPAALSTRPSVFDSSDKHLAQLSQKLSARRSFGNRSSTASTHSSPTKSRGQTIPSLPAHFGKVRSPPLAADSSQQQQSLSMQHHETCLDCHRQSLRQFAPSRASALSNDLLYYQRQTMSFWDTQMRDQQQFRQRAHEAEAQRNNSHRQAERQRQLEQQKRQEQQELWRAREMQLIEERVQREKHTEQQLQQQESQEQQQQDKTQRLQQLQRQQHQQQQHLANAYAQAQTQQQHHIFHFSASANRIEYFEPRPRSPPLQSSQASQQSFQHSPPPHQTASKALRSAPLTTDGAPHPSPMPGQTYSSASAGELPGRQSSLHHLLTLNRHGSPPRSAPPKPIQPLAQTESSLRSHEKDSNLDLLRQVSSAGPSSSQPAATPASSRLDQPSRPRQQTQWPHRQQDQTLWSPKSPLSRDATSQQAHSRPGYSGGPSTPAQLQMTLASHPANPADAQVTHSHSTSCPRDSFRSTHSALVREPVLAQESSRFQQRAAASSSASAHQDDSNRTSWAGSMQDLALADYPLSPPRCASSSSSSLSATSPRSSPRLEAPFASSATANRSNIDALKTFGRDRTHVHVEHYRACISTQIDLLAKSHRPRRSLPSQTSSFDSLAPLLPSPSPSPFPLCSPALLAPPRQAQEDALWDTDTLPPRDAHDCTPQRGISLASADLTTSMEEDLQQRDVPEQENSVQSAVGQLDGSEKSVFMKALQAEARQVDDLQASALLQEARRAEAMQAAEARRAGVLQADDICGRDLLLADTPLGGYVSLSSNATPEKPRTASLVRVSSSENSLRSRGDWTVEEIASSFEELLKSLLVDHGRNVEYAIDMIKPRTRPACVSFDEFADLPVQDIDASSATTNRILVCGKLYRDNQRRPKTRTTPVRVLPIKSPGRAVPKYRFHHVEIAKNILSPNMPLMFIPHLRDLENNSDDKRKHDQWIEELESMERKSGFDSTKLFQKGDTTRRNEFTKQLSEYLDHWIARLGIDNCSKASLIRYMANESQKSHSITPQQKDSLIDSCGEDSATPRAAAVASMITEAFNRVLKSRDVTLYDVLKQDGAVENVFDPKKASKAKDQDKEASLEQIQQYLGTYTSLKCMICHTHSCEHGEFDAENVRRCFSIDDLGGKLWKYIERRRDRQASDLRTTQKNAQGPLTISSGNSMPVRGEGGSGSGGKAALLGFNPSCKLNDPCKNKCYRSYDVGDDAQLSREWTEDETSLLRSLHMTFGNSTSKVPCTLCPLLGRYCWEVYRRAKELGLRISPCIALPPPADVLPRSPVVKPVSWYDRHRKTLNGDWSDHTHTHLHALREQREPCNHEGPCTAASGCSCVEAKLLCERFCQCTDESCAIKFTGCACHVNGKTCYTRQKEGKPCICVQLNRECDPVLCGSCGARERADPENREYDALHSTGCQNVSLQRGKSKAVVLGQSQLQGCGYGLFTAEDIEADEFIIEYVGELITHDEGVRREARRGDFSDQGANASYLFTLLEQDGIWVDAAIYGNLSRYINHASESDKRGCNITPKVLYVNGEFRIRFMAMRDIRAGEELFFDYGENFPNLTKKLLEDMAFASDDEAMAVIRSAKGRISGRNKGGVSMSSRHGAASRSNSRRRKTRGRPSTSLARSGLSSNGKTGESVNIVRNASRQRRARPRRGDDRGASSAVVEDPLVDEDESDDGSGDDIDHMDLDGSKLQRSHRACKQASQKRRKRLLDGDEVGEDEDGKVHNGRGNSLKRKRRLPVNEDRETEQFYRNGRGRRRSNAKPSLFAVEASTELADLSRRLSSRARTQPAHQEQDKQGRASTNPDSSAASTDVDDDTETDEQPRRKRLRTVTRRQSQSATATDATGVTASSIEHPNPDTDMVNIDSDVQISGRRPLHTGRTRQRNRTVESAGSKWPDYNGNKSEPDRDGLAASTAVHLDTAGKDQGTVLIPGQSHDPQQTEAGNELKENGPTTTTTVRAAKPRRSRNVVPDSDDDLDLGASQPSRNERTAPWSQPPAASPNAHSKSLPPIGTPISRPKTPRNGSGSHGEAHKAVYGVYNSGGGDGHSRRTLRSGEARPDSSLGAPGSRGASSARPPRMCLTPTKSMTRLAGDDESGADSVDRSHRRRQLPARYRSDE